MFRGRSLGRFAVHMQPGMLQNGTSMQSVQTCGHMIPLPGACRLRSTATGGMMPLWRLRRWQHVAEAASGRARTSQQQLLPSYSSLTNQPPPHGSLTSPASAAGPSSPQAQQQQPWQCRLPVRQDVRCSAFNPEPQMVLNKEYMAPEHQLYWEEVGGGRARVLEHSAS